MNPLVVLALIIAFEGDSRHGEVPVDLARGLAGTALGIIVVGACATAVARWTSRRLVADFGHRSRILEWDRRLNALRSVGALAVFALSIHVFGWAEIVRLHFGFERWIAIDELLILAPFFLGEALSLASRWRVAETVRALKEERDLVMPPPMARAAYVNFQFRAQFGVMGGGVILMMTLRDVADRVVPHWLDRPALALAMVVVMSLVVMTLSPLLLRYVWRTAPLPAGALREELTRLSRSLGFRHSNILVWRTGGAVANAAVSGLVPQLRYVLLSDALVEQLEPEELAAVFGHEVGHIRHHHLAYYFFFVIASMLFVALVGSLSQEAILACLDERTAETVEMIFGYAPLDLVLLVPYFLFAFGYLSRTFERQADVYGARAASQAARDLEGGSPIEAKASSRRDPAIDPRGARAFIASLERLAAINGIPLAGWTWRHGSIAARLEFLDTLVFEPELADRFDQKVRRLRWAVALALGAGVGAMLGLGRWLGYA